MRKGVRPGPLRDMKPHAMHHLVAWALLIAAHSQIGEADDSEWNMSEARFMLMPDGKGEPRIAFLSGSDPKSTATIEDVRFYLYTRDNRDEPEVGTINDTCRPVFQHFRSSRRTKVLVHGFGDSVAESYMVPLLKDAFLEQDDYNVLAVDWSSLAATPWYGAASRNTVPVGGRLASLLTYLQESHGADMRSFHLLGFSLGAHVVGVAGHHLQLQRITGLDPAHVMYGDTPMEDRLDPGDAKLVEVVHTSGGYLGFDSPLGHRDFFPNGGYWPQPGCILDLVATCSHRRAYYYFAEAVKSGHSFHGVRCDSWQAYQSGNCSGDSAEMWREDDEDRTEGTFFMTTNSAEPFALPDNFH